MTKIEKKMEEVENLHGIQREILNKLLFKEEARFSELKNDEIESDQFNFHLKRLLELELVEKNKNKKYLLSTKGKEYANRLDTQKIKIERQAKLSVLIGAVKKENNTIKYLVQKRLKQPYYGFYGFITGKVGWGEWIKEAAERELFEETGLKGNLTLQGVKHKIDYSRDGRLLEDKIFFVYKATEIKGKLIMKFEGGENIWLKLDEIFHLENLFDGAKESLELFDKRKLVFREDEYKVDKY